MAKFNAIAITVGTANPKAQGQDATKTPTPLSTIQQISHFQILTRSTEMIIVQTITVIKLINITIFTK